MKKKFKSNLILVLIESWFNTLNWLCLTRWILYLIQYKTQLKSFLELINYRVDLQNFTGFSTNPLKFLSRTSGERPKEFKGVFVWWKVVSWKPLSKLSCVCLSLEKLVNITHFPVKEKFSSVSRKVFSFYFGRKTLCRNCEKFKNIILFADYIKFDPGTPLIFAISYFPYVWFACLKKWSYF